MQRENVSPPNFSPPHSDIPFVSPHSVFPPNNSLSFPSPPSSPSSSNSDLETSLIAPDSRLYQARLLLQNDQLRHRYNLSRTHLHDVLEDSESLRMWNVELRQSNQELVNRLSLFKTQRNLLEEFRRLSMLGHQDPVNPTSVIYNTNNNTSITAAASLPKSISVRSKGYRKSSRPVQTPSPLDADRDKYVYVANRRRQEEEMEMEVYDQQGMVKTELCNKWQETGGCSYGESCQFAHGLKELRPVIRHPRYKTQACKMVLRGGRCPYAHRCHFRHALTDQERMLLVVASLPF